MSSPPSIDRSGTRPRIVSLVPSATETLVTFGADVIGCTKYCEQPDIPTFGGTKNPDIEGIVALAPDVVVVDVEENRREDADALTAAGIELVVTDVRSIAGAAVAVGQLARAAGARVARLASAAIVPAIAERNAYRSPQRADVLVPIWRRPWMALGPGTYGADMLSALGFRVLPRKTEEAESTAATRYPTFDPATLSGDGLGAPALILVPSEPYEFSDAHLAELAEMLPNTPIVRVDGQDLLWWGMRTPDALDRLRDALGGLISAGT